MFTLKMIEGSRSGLAGLSSMLISQSVAKALFGNDDAMDKLVKLDNNASFKVSGVYQDCQPTPLCMMLPLWRHLSFTRHPKQGTVR